MAKRNLSAIHDWKHWIGLRDFVQKNLKHQMQKIIAVVVTFNPDKFLLLELINSLSQIDGCIIVNNGGELNYLHDFSSKGKITQIDMPKNVGVATALNAGCILAEKKGADFIITFDQDSKPEVNMIDNLINAFKALTKSGINIGALGPVQIDRRTGHPSPFLTPVRWKRKLSHIRENQMIEVDHVIMTKWSM